MLSPGRNTKSGVVAGSPKRGCVMMTLPELAVDALEEFLGSFARRRFGDFGASQAHIKAVVPAAVRMALESIGNSDALYHNFEHTLLVTLAGHDILRGRALTHN